MPIDEVKAKVKTGGKPDVSGSSTDQLLFNPVKMWTFW